jgi:hypothetical protein
VSLRRVVVRTSDVDTAAGLDRGKNRDHRGQTRLARRLLRFCYSCSGQNRALGGRKQAPILSKWPFPGNLTGTAVPAIPTLDQGTSARRDWASFWVILVWGPSLGGRENERTHDRLARFSCGPPDVYNTSPSLISVRSVVQLYPGPFCYLCTPRVFRRSRGCHFCDPAPPCCPLALRLQSGAALPRALHGHRIGPLITGQDRLRALPASQRAEILERGVLHPWQTAA